MEHKYVFISYSSANKAIADATCHMLEECGIPCWIAPRNIIPGKTWAGNIVQAIRDCSLMVLIYSEESNSSSQVANEVDKAFSHGKTIIPFMVDSTPMNDDFDYYLSRKHWLVAYPDYKEMLMPLVEAVATNIGVEIRRPQVPDPVSTASSEDVSSDVAPKNPLHDAAIEAARKLLQSYELDMAFAELVRPALEDCQEAQFLMRTIIGSYSRMRKIDSFRFKYIKENADNGNAFAQYITSYYYMRVERNPDESFRYANLCADQGKEYGFQVLAHCYELGVGVKIDNARNRELLDKAVNMGDLFAMLRLAKDNLYGWSRKRNPKRAFILLKQCMKMHVPESFVLMGDMFDAGNGVERDEQRAKELYEKALDDGYLEAYNNLAWSNLVDMVTFQYKDDEDIQKGISLLRKGIGYGVVECLSTLAFCYENGIGVKQKAEQAFRWYKKAAESGHPSSFFNVGYMYYVGEGCTKNYSEAWKWFVRGSQIPNGSCFYQLGVMCQNGHGQEGKVEADCVGYYEQSLYMAGSYAENSALELYHIFRTRSLETDPLMRDDEDTCRDYKWVSKDNRRAVGYLKQAAGMDNVSSNIYFKYGAILCTDGNGFTDEFEGIRYLKLAVQKGEPRAAVMLAKMYEKGELVEKDLEQAHEYYQLAADKNCGDGYAGLAKELCSQIMGDVDEADGNLPDMDEETKRKLLNQAYDYVCEADRLGCKAVCPLEDTLSAFMIEDDLLTPDECNRLVKMNGKYARMGNVQSIVDRGVMFHMGRLVQSDLEIAIEAYQQAARLGKECAANNLGELYSGKDENMPEEKLDKAKAAYWYAKDCSDESNEAYQILLQTGHELVLNSEKISSTANQEECVKWVFPYFCDPAFTSASSRLRVFEWAFFPDGIFANTEPKDGEADVRYLPEDVDRLYKTYVELHDLLSSTYGWSDSQLPHLCEEDFFPCLSMPHLLELAQMGYKAWYVHVKHGKGKWLQQQRQKLEKLTLMRQDLEAVLDLAEECPDNDLQLLLIDIVWLCIDLQSLADIYWELIALNGLIEDPDAVGLGMAEYFVKDFADRFFDGTDVLPRSRAIACRLYRLVPYLPGVEERLEQCSSC